MGRSRPVNLTPEHWPAGARALASIGVVGGLALLAAFVVDIPPPLNTVRLLLFIAGGVAVVFAARGAQLAVSRRLALAGAVPLILAGLVSTAWIILSIGRDRPFAGDFGLAGFYAGLGLWLAHAWYGIVALKIGVVWRWPALVLVVGSLLAITGMDRLDLTSPANPTIFGPLSLLGIALNGIAWVLMGLEIVARDMCRHRPTTTAPDAADA
jgi:hypothetical protein